MTNMSIKNSNPWYVEDNRTDEEKFLATWAPSCGMEDAMRAWDEKQRGRPDRFHLVMGDIKPYQSMIDGSMIESRSKHRAHLKQHGCIEVGNETKHLKSKPVTPPPGLKEEIIRQTFARR